jgi:SAM-dependent methyltransferase
VRVEERRVPNSERTGGRRFDRDHGVTTHAVMFLSQLDDGRVAEAYAHATHYEAVPVAEMRAMLACVPPDAIRTSAFVDVGAGMGRAILIATEYPFRSITGIELSPALYEIARDNVERAHGFETQCRDIALVCGDARRRKFPAGNLVVFLFNPFDDAALRTTLERIVASRTARDTVHVLYDTPVHRDVLEAFAAETLADLPFGMVVRLNATTAKPK